MDKNKIINYLNDKFLKEEATPGIDLTNQVKKESDKINKEALKTIEKDVASYDKEIKKNVGKAKMPANKFNYNGDNEKKYHDQMEIMNGQEMIQYDREPNQEFKDRAKEAIVGSSRMGNKAGEGTANVEPTWGASSADFGKNLVKRAGDSAEERQDAEYKIISFGDDIETVPKGSKPMSKFSAFVKEGLEQDSENIASNKPYGTKDQHDFENSEEARKPLDGTEDEEENKNNTKPQIKEGMKRLNFKKEFNGVGNALKMIPESYRVDNKVFEMTDGNESYKIRWEGTLTEGKAVVLTASNKTMVNEDIQKMKHLMGYKSQDTLGTVKGKARINENAVFGDIFNKTKALLEGEDIEDQDAPEKDADKVVSQAKEAKKDVEGSVSTEKGTQAPAPKTGSMESLDDAKSQAKEAKEHVEGSVESKLGLGLGVKTKEGNWDAISVPQAADAKKHVTMNEGVTLGESYFAPMDENMYEEMMEEGMMDEEWVAPEKKEISLNDILEKLNSAVTTEDGNQSDALIKSAIKDLGEKIKTMGQKGLEKGADYLRKKLGGPVEEGMYEEEQNINEYGDDDLDNEERAEQEALTQKYKKRILNLVPKFNEMVSKAVDGLGYPMEFKIFPSDPNMGAIHPVEIDGDEITISCDEFSDTFNLNNFYDYGDSWDPKINYWFNRFYKLLEKGVNSLESGQNYYKFYVIDVQDNNRILDGQYSREDAESEKRTSYSDFPGARVVSLKQLVDMGGTPLVIGG